MSTFLAKRDLPIKRQAGDSFDISFLVPMAYPLAGKIPKISIYRNDGSLIISKGGDECINRDKRIVFFFFSPEDLKRDWGKHRYEVQFSDASGKVVHTVGRGPFIYTKEYISN